MKIPQRYKHTEFGLIPDDWVLCTFKDVLTTFSSGATPYRGIPEYYNGNIRWISSGELNYNVIYDTIEHISANAVRNTNLHILNPSTFLMAITGLEAEGTRGKCAFVGAPATTNQSCLAINGTDRMCVEYLFWFYRMWGDYLAFKYCQGTKQQSYTAEIVKKLPIYCPITIKEQNKIAEALSDVDALITALDKKIAKKRLIKQGAMQQLLTGKMRLAGFSAPWIEKKIYEINAQIELLEKSQKEQVNEVEKIKNELLKNINNEKEKLKNDYFEKIDITEINRLLNSTNLSYEIEKIQSNLNEKNIELHRLELDKENILPKLEELAENEEKLTYNKEIYEELKEKNNAINLAKQALETAYQKMKNDVTPKFTQKLSENINNITNGKYNKIIINEEDGIIIELPNGEYKNANTLSVGTIQQLYMAFRLSMAEDISDEEMPIILDEIFAFSDDSRMEDSIKNLYNNYANSHQILLFTCTNREEQILQKLNFEYNKITL